MKVIVLFVCLAVGGTIGARLKRASGGEEIKIEDAPYFVSLQWMGKHLCGGAFISNQHVLTTAHCVLDGSFKPLYNTEVVSATDHPWKKDVVHRILNISAHEGFRERRPACDIAVITLSAHVVWNEKQHEIALANAEPPSPTRATFVGLQFLMAKNSRPGLRELGVNIRRIDPTPNNPDEYGPIIYGKLPKFQNIGRKNLGGALVYEGRMVGIASEIPSTSRGSCHFVNVLKFKTFIEESMRMEPSPTEILWRPSVVDFDDIEWT